MKTREFKINKLTNLSADYIANLLMSGTKVVVYIADKKEH